MLDGYQLLLKAQCSESLDLLGLSQAEILIIIENERRYDVKTRLCERIAFLIYQDSNFGRLPVSPNTFLSDVFNCSSAQLFGSFRVHQQIM